MTKRKVPFNERNDFLFTRTIRTSKNKFEI